MADNDERSSNYGNCTHLWVVIFILSFFLLIAIIFFASTISADPLFIQQLKDKEFKDSVQVALALGRLDAIVIMLTLVTIGVAGLAFYGFKEIKEKAIRVARRTTKEIAKSAIREEVRVIASKEARAVYRNFLKASLMPKEDMDEMIKNIDKPLPDLSTKNIVSEEFKKPKDIELLYMDKDEEDE